MATLAQLGLTDEPLRTRAQAPMGAGLRTLRVPALAPGAVAVAVAAPAPTPALAPAPVSAPPQDEDEQQAALRICRTHPLVDLGGTAGVGKTWVARQLLHDPGTILAATTGIASVNLGEGTTINALLRYFDTASMRTAFLNGYLAAQVRKLRRSGMRRLVVDEKSMLNADQLTYLVRAIDAVNGTTSYDDSLEDDVERPAAHTDPISLVLVGDFGQLPPVPDKHPVTLKNLPVGYACESPEWKCFETTTLRTIRRQTDQDFIAALHAVRLGRAEEALDFFTPERFTTELVDTFAGTTIFAKNDAVDRYNQLRLDTLRGTPMDYATIRTGKQRGDWKLVPDSLCLRQGTLVMLLANHRKYADHEDEVGELVYVNGDLGTLVGTSRTTGAWQVCLQRTGAVVTVLPVSRQNLIPLEPGRRKALIQEFGREEADARIEGRNEIIGTVTYMPLRCAYACTVHKTQGLTLDAVQVNLRDPFFRQPGMLFVALSRARTAAGLRIVGDQRGFMERCTVNKKIQRWL